jgi:hypothetical protein
MAYTKPGWHSGGECAPKWRRRQDGRIQTVVINDGTEGEKAASERELFTYDKSFGFCHNINK